MFTDILSIYVLVNGCSGNTTRKYKSFCSPRTTHHDSPGKLLNGFNFKPDEVELSLILLGTKCNLRLIYSYKYAFQWDAYPPLQWPRGGSLSFFTDTPVHRDTLHRDPPFTETPSQRPPFHKDPLHRDP